MNMLGTVAMFAWLPAVLFFFSSMPPRRAVLAAFVVAWLLLPSNVGWKFSGLPDYTKSSATILGVLMGLVIFDSSRLAALRFRWFDLPMLVFCTCPLPGALALGVGAYEGVSAILEQLITWGLPYLIGRLYFSDLEGLRQLSLGILVGGLVYVPFCLIEVRMSPMFETWIYGINHWEPTRYGGYRPKVFLSSGLELGMWMTCASLLSVRFWAVGAIRQIQGYPFGLLTLGLLVTTVLCKSTGALALLLTGLGALWMASRFRSSWPVWLLIAVAPFYTGTRVAGLWSGREVLEVAKFADEERAESLAFRMRNEDLLIDHSLKNAVLGGGRERGAMVLDSSGKARTICDGYWIIIFGRFGLVGLASLVAVLLLPVVLLIRRWPVSTWSRPEVAPAPALAMLLVLIMIDEVSNAMLNPIYAIIVGGLMGLAAGPRRGRLQEAEDALAGAADAAAEGDRGQSELLFRRAIELASVGDQPDGFRVRAGALEGLGASLMAAGRLDEADRALGEAVAVREAIAGDAPGVDHDGELARARGQFARVLVLLGRVDEAVVERRRVVDLWNRLASRAPGDPETRAHRADALNDLAWLMASEPGAGAVDPGQTVRLAEEAARLAPDLATCWNTLGVARYRAGDWAGAVEALERSISAGPTGGTAFDHFFLAMALQRLGEPSRAGESFERAVDWADRHLPGHSGLARFRLEALEMMGRPGRAAAEVP